MHSRNRLYKNAIAIILTCVVALSSGCAGSKSKEDNLGYAQDTEKTKDTQTTQDSPAEENASSEAAEGKASSEAADSNSSEDDSANNEAEADLSVPIEFSYQNHPLLLKNGDTDYGSGNYLTVELDKSEKERFPELLKALDHYNDTFESEVTNNLNSSVEEISEMFESGWGMPYEYFHDFYPVRSDGKAFSFVVLNYTFLAGAHGYTDYTDYNFDPVTGSAIKFEDVVKVTDDFANIVLDELLKQNAGLDEVMDKEAFLEEMPSRVEHDASGLAWAVDYDGVRLYFEDYAMGSYAAGSQEVKISWFDHPELFTDTYKTYEKDSLPVITDVAKQLKDADTVTLQADPSGTSQTSSKDSETEDGEGEDWWYHAVVTNPGWSAWTKEGIDTDVGTPSVELKEISHDTTDWLDEDAWSAKTGIALPKRLPYNDGTYSYSAVNEADEGTLSLTVMDTTTQTLEGNYYFDEFLGAPDQGEGLFADFTEPYIRYAILKENNLYVAIAHLTYASANPHNAYIVCIDTMTGETVWKSDDLVCGSNNFIIEGDSIICGYGFTDEPDYIYILNRINGKTQKQIKVKSAPYYFIRQDDELYVLTYNTEYHYQIK